MNSILLDLFYGNLTPFDLPVPEKAQQKNQKAFDLYDAYCIALTPEQRKHFDEIFSLHAEAQSIEIESVFISGFRVGAQIMLETLMGK